VLTIQELKIRGIFDEMESLSLQETKLKD